jgi:hypothetical protein
VRGEKRGRGMDALLMVFQPLTYRERGLSSTLRYRRPPGRNAAEVI